MNDSVEFKLSQFESIKSEGERLFVRFNMIGFVMLVSFRAHKVLRALAIPFIFALFFFSYHTITYSACYIGLWAFLRLVVFELSVMCWNKYQVNKVLVTYLLLKRELNI